MNHHELPGHEAVGETTMKGRPPADSPDAEVISEMVCVCGPERLAASDRLREDARRILEAGTDQWRPPEVTDADLLTLRGRVPRSAKRPHRRNPHRPVVTRRGPPKPLGQPPEPADHHAANADPMRPSRRRNRPGDPDPRRHGHHEPRPRVAGPAPTKGRRLRATTRSAAGVGEHLPHLHASENPGELQHIRPRVLPSNRTHRPSSATLSSHHPK